MRLFPSLVYGKGHAYSNPFSGSGDTDTRDEADAHGSRSVPRIAGSARTTRRCSIVGDATPDSIKPLLEKYLAAWKAPSEPLPKKNLATVSAQAKPRVFLDEPHGVRSSR